MSNFRFCSAGAAAMVDSDERQGDDTLFFILWYDGHARVLW